MRVPMHTSVICIESDQVVLFSESPLSEVYQSVFLYLVIFGYK